MRLRSLLTVALAASAGLSGAATAAAEPEPTPAFPNVASYMPVNPADYTVNGGKWLGFAGPAGVVCIVDVLAGNYGCSGPLPGAPEGINLVSAGPTGAPTFATSEAPYAAAGPVRPLAPNTRLTYRQIYCGADATGAVACLNSRDQVGFIVGPTATSIKLPPPPPPAPAPVAPADGVAPPPAAPIP